jgi:hypothetical protein
MKSIGIKELQLNPANLTKALDAHEYTLITKHSKPIGIALSFDDEILTKGLKNALLFDAYRSSAISLGQLCSALALSKKKALKILSLLNIDVIDYDFNDDIKTINKLL